MHSSSHSITSTAPSSIAHPLRRKDDLGGEWQFAWSKEDKAIRTIADARGAGFAPRRAVVPGNFELDLEANGLLDADPYFALNLAARREYESVHLWYFRTFDCPANEADKPVLIFEGLDCFADVYVNGDLIGSSANALVEHVFPLGQLRAKGNEIVVHLRPASEEARRFAYPPGAVAHAFASESLFVRKPPHAFGWDIMPRAVSGGIWRPVRIEFLPECHFDSVWLETLAASAEQAELTLHFRARLAPGAIEGYRVELHAACGESTFEASTPVIFEAGRISFSVKNPRRWWPRDRGEQSLYRVAVRLLHGDRELDQVTFRHGIRTVELHRTSLTNERGEGEFCFLVNGERVFIHGTNWVPADAYHSRDAARLPTILALARDCGCNMIRCWGGNVYEADSFFDFCDENGILIWQDFALACSVYSQDDDFQRVIAEEARKVVRRLRSHASLVLWAGDNECDLAYDWYRRGSPEQNQLTRRVLPNVLASEDPSRPYLPSSPYVDATAVKAPRTALPEIHLWGPPRDAFFRSVYYTHSLCHFVSEIGYHGCPAGRSVRKFISSEKLWPPGNDEWWFHATSPILGLDTFSHRIEMMRKQVDEMFGSYPDNLDDFAWRSQCLQAEANKFFIELFRGAKWRRTGILWWNLIDGWPQFSDAVVDYYFEKKLAYDYIRRAQQPVLAMLREPVGWQQDLVISNETREALEVRYVVRDIDQQDPLAEGVQTAAADAVTLVRALPFPHGRHRFLVIDWESSRGSGRSHYLAGNPPFDALQYRRWIERAYGAETFSDRGF